MAKRTNYSFEKRQKEAKRKQKQAAKLEKKRLNKKGSAENEVPVGGSTPLTTDVDPAAASEAADSPEAPETPKDDSLPKEGA